MEIDPRANWLIPLILIILGGSCRVRNYSSDSRPVDHEEWTALLQEHVSPEGWVDYPGFIRDSARLEAYLEKLGRNHPNPTHWSREERMAYWINAYNAFTVQLVSRHYPVKSIKDIRRGIPFINSVWDIRFISLEGQKYNLNNIEHGILRAKFEDPRIHFALNCASVSCPVLRREAFTADQLEEQLDQAGRTFLGDTLRNRIQPDRVAISSIFKWFRGDFTRGDQTLIEFLDRFTVVEIEPDAGIEFLDYDWGLNDPPGQDL